MNTLKFVYIGKDKLFSEGVVDTLNTFYEPEQTIFSTLFLEEIEEDLVAKIIPKVIAENPNIIIIDFSFKFENIKILARRLRLSLDSSTVTCVGVLNQPESSSIENLLSEIENSKEELRLASLTQVPIIHYKGNDSQKVIFDAIYLNNGSKSMRGEYATFKNADLLIEATYFSTLTHILDDALVIESSIPVKEDRTILLRSDYILPIDKKNFLVKKRNQEFLSTKFVYRYRLDINFENLSGLEQADAKKLRNFISTLSNKFKSYSRIKLLMIQNELEVLSQLKKPMTHYPYLIRYSTKFFKDMKMVQKFRPHIISVELSPDLELTIKEKSELDTKVKEVESRISLEEIDKLVQIVNTMDGYSPIIAIFNCPKFTEDYRNKSDYPLLMTSKSKMSFELLLNMLEIYNVKRKQEDPYEDDPLIKSEEQPFPIHSLDKESQLKHDIPIRITSLSEHEITFVTPEELPMRGVLFTNDPVQFYFTIAEPIDSLERSKDGFHYFALINGISPTDAQELRKFVNMLFFKEKNEKKKQELDAFKALNEQHKSKVSSSDSNGTETPNKDGKNNKLS